jgi:hypothetical protein
VIVAVAGIPAVLKSNPDKADTWVSDGILNAFSPTDFTESGIYISVRFGLLYI